MALFSKHTPPLQQRTSLLTPSMRADAAARFDRQATTDTAAALLRHYRPMETRATGGFGSIEVCWDTHLHRRVAIKRMPLAQPGQQGGMETKIQDAMREAFTASMLQHPNIVALYDFNYDSTYAYLVMEYVDGMSLEEFLNKVDGHSLTYDEAAAVADALGSALAFAHENGVLHLDIKPANVLIDRNGHIKLTDFGMATLSQAAGFDDARGGTIGYMPPEQLDVQTGKVDARTDEFALAAVLYECLLGTAPFRAPTPSGSLNKIIKGVAYPSELLPDFPPAAENALISALSPMPQDRPNGIEAFCNQFLARLGNVRAGEKSLAQMIANITAAEEAENGPEEDPAPGATEFDPLFGYLGERSGKAKPVFVRLVAGASAAYLAYSMLGAGFLEGTALLAAALAIGAAAAIAPQVGSALAIAGFIIPVAATSIESAGLIAFLPLLVPLCALALPWWLVWGRRPQTSAAALLFLALALAIQSPLQLAGLGVAFAAAFLCTSLAEAAAVFGIVLGALTLVALANGAVLTAQAAAEALFTLPFACGLGAAVAGTLASCAAMRLYATKAAEGASRGLLFLPAIICGITGFLLYCSAKPVEIGALEGPALAGAVGVGLVSSIILWICVYLFGLETEQPEGDRS